MSKQHTLESSDVKGFSVNWTDSANPTGVKPPNPQFKSVPLPANMVALTQLPNPTDINGTMPVGLLQSNRQPYAVEHAFTKYGELSTGLGTDMGR